MILPTFKKELPMLARFWLWLGRLLGKMLLIVLVIGLLGWGVTTVWFAWQHRGPVSAIEQIPPGEAAMTQDVIQTAVRIVDQHREPTWSGLTWRRAAGGGSRCRRRPTRDGVS